MRMALRTKRWTLAELDRLPDYDGNKYEVVRGDLFVTPPPNDMHETILARLSRRLDPYVERHGLGYVYHPRSVVKAVPHSQVEPDLMVRQAHANPRGKWDDAPLPILVVEVLSDSTRRRDFVEKRDLYADLGIDEYWIVDGDERTVFVVRAGQPEMTVSSGVMRWQAPGASEALQIDLDELFGPRI